MSQQPVTREPEVVIARLRPHARAMFWPTIALIAICAATGYFIGKFPEPWSPWIVLAGAALLAVLLWVLPYFAWLARYYTITTRRIVLRSGFLVRVRQELLHSRGYDVTVRKNGLQTLFRTGDVLINTGLEHATVLRDVPDADLVQAALHDLMEQGQTMMAGIRQREQARPHDETTVWGSR
ncbi:PH domain-containing protein [Ruicaihuangia caeni]|uniref:PH domain-containing protein n=1 Tax=Ruicaihuangia caeni TaxID=3042517 RepID=UPI00338DBFAB